MQRERLEQLSARLVERMNESVLRELLAKRLVVVFMNACAFVTRSKIGKLFQRKWTRLCLGRITKITEQKDDYLLEITVDLGSRKSQTWVTVFRQMFDNLDPWSFDGRGVWTKEEVLGKLVLLEVYHCDRSLLWYVNELITQDLILLEGEHFGLGLRVCRSGETVRREPAFTSTIAADLTEFRGIYPQ